MNHSVSSTIPTHPKLLPATLKHPLPLFATLKLFDYKVPSYIVLPEYTYFAYNTSSSFKVPQATPSHPKCL